LTKTWLQSSVVYAEFPSLSAFVVIQAKIMINGRNCRNISTRHARRDLTERDTISAHDQSQRDVTASTNAASAHQRIITAR